MNQQLLGKVAIVSGGAGGMGITHTRALVHEGASVVSFDLHPGSVPALIEELGAEKVQFIAGDVTSPQDWNRVVTFAQEQHGRVDILVNNAGICPVQRLESVTEAEFRKVIDVNQTGVFLGMQAVLPAMRDHGGSIVNIASNAGIVGFADIFGYVASKWAVRGMTRAAALELADLGIRVNAVCPGDTDTQMLRSNLATAGDSVPPVEDLPFRRWARPEEISAAVVFLASDASSYMSGTDLVVDGAFTAA